jgi:hypothetical protein
MQTTSTDQVNLPETNEQALERFAPTNTHPSDKLRTLHPSELVHVGGGTYPAANF